MLSHYNLQKFLEQLGTQLGYKSKIEDNNIDVVWIRGIETIILEIHYTKNKSVIMNNILKCNQFLPTKQIHIALNRDVSKYLKTLVKGINPIIVESLKIEKREAYDRYTKTMRGILKLGDIRASALKRELISMYGISLRTADRIVTEFINRGELKVVYGIRNPLLTLRG